MRFSVWPDPERPWSEVAEVVTHCEQAGWGGAYISDHFMPNRPDGETVDGPVLECWTALAGLAALTTRLKLASLVCGNTYRHPAVLANMAATVDQISVGRFTLGLGAGWQENEHTAYGMDFGDVRSRLDRLEEACAIVTSLLREPRTNFDGHHYRLRDAPCDPKPVQTRLPLLIGGKGEQRTMRITARYADEWNAWCDIEQFRHRTGVVDQRCDEIERDPAEIARSTQAFVFLSDDQAWLERHRSTPSDRPRLIGTPTELVDQIAAYGEAGLDELIVPDWTMGPLARRLDTLDRFLTEVAPHFLSSEPVP
jgi:F420-dependent oxidoreductase-like protein